MSRLHEQSAMSAGYYRHADRDSAAAEAWTEQVTAWGDIAAESWDKPETLRALCLAIEERLGTGIAWAVVSDLCDKAEAGTARAEDGKAVAAILYDLPMPEGE